MVCVRGAPDAYMALWAGAITGACMMHSILSGERRPGACMMHLTIHVRQGEHSMGHGAGVSKAGGVLEIKHAWLLHSGPLS